MPTLVGPAGLPSNTFPTQLRHTQSLRAPCEFYAAYTRYCTCIESDFQRMSKILSTIFVGANKVLSVMVNIIPRTCKFMLYKCVFIYL